MGVPRSDLANRPSANKTPDIPSDRGLARRGSEEEEEEEEARKERREEKKIQRPGEMRCDRKMD